MSAFPNGFSAPEPEIKFSIFILDTNTLFHNTNDMNGTIIFSHYGCLGHTSRVFTLSQALNINILSLSEPQDFLDYRKLNTKIRFCPYPVFGKKTFFSGGNNKYLFNKKRIDWVFNEIKKNDFVIFEYFPFGRHQLFKEFLFLINRLKHNGIKVISSVGYPILNTRHIMKTNVITEKLDHIFFHCDKQEIAFWAKENPMLLDFIKHYKNKITFTGYINSMPLPFKAYDSIPSFGSYILVIRGSGIVMDQLIIHALQITDKNIIAILGPSSNLKILPDIPHTAGTAILKTVKDMDRIIKNARIVISTASYNSSIKIMKYNKPAILIPFTGTLKYPGLNEQSTRAKFLKDTMPLCEIIGHSRLSANALNKKIQLISSKIPQASKHLARFKFNGEAFTAKKLFSILQK